MIKRIHELCQLSKLLIYGVFKPASELENMLSHHLMINLANSNVCPAGAVGEVA